MVLKWISWPSLLVKEIAVSKTEAPAWDWDDLAKDHGPLFIFGTSRTTYNYMDAGNFLWG
jgi:hypothetical protein